jgi:saccharopine dehydrogenase-like NADP-dependent oxidoreductase
MATLTGINSDGNVRAAAAQHVGVDPDADSMHNLEWLGLFSDEPAADLASPLDLLSSRLQEELCYGKGERDMIVLHHDIMAEFEGNGKRTKITSTLIDYGIPGADFSMARTVSLPAAIAARLILEGKIRETGVHIPVRPALYNPILNALESQGILFNEIKQTL